MLKWVEKVYSPYVKANIGGFSHLLLDDYAAHKVGGVLDAVYNTGSFVSVMPGGSTSKVQVLDVSVNKPFKDKFRSMWVQWMASVNIDNNLVVTREMLAQWVLKVWMELDISIITNGWKTCGYY